MNIRKIGVVGAGQMGSGIAQVCAASGYDVVVYDSYAPMLEKSRAGIAGSLGKFVEKGKLEASARDAALARLTYSEGLDGLAGCDLVVEAIVEQLEPKLDLFRALGGICRPDAILASNTSSLPITQLAAAVPNP